MHHGTTKKTDHEQSNDSQSNLREDETLWRLVALSRSRNQLSDQLDNMFSQSTQPSDLQMTDTAGTGASSWSSRSQPTKHSARGVRDDDVSMARVDDLNTFLSPQDRALGRFKAADRGKQKLNATSYRKCDSIPRDPHENSHRQTGEGSRALFLDNNDEDDDALSDHERTASQDDRNPQIVSHNERDRPQSIRRDLDLSTGITSAIKDAVDSEDESEDDLRPSRISELLSRADSSVCSPVISRIRHLLSELSDHSNITSVLRALQELNSHLVLSTEETMIGRFPSEKLVSQLVSVLKDPIFEELAEIPLEACTALSYLMEALPSCKPVIVNAGVVPVLCSKLLEIQFIDLAEEALGTLRRISEEYPVPVAQAGGITACLSFIDFFPIHSQRTALAIAANCCRSLNESSLSFAIEMLPTLQSTVLHSEDIDSIEKAIVCVCWTAKAQSEKEFDCTLDHQLLERLVSFADPSREGSRLKDGVRSLILQAFTSIIRNNEDLQSILLRNATMLQIIIGIDEDSIMNKNRELLQSALLLVLAIVSGIHENTCNSAKWLMKLGQTIIQVYQYRTESEIRQHVLTACLAASKNFSGGQLLSVNFSPWICSVIAQRESDDFVLQALKIASNLIRKAPQHYVTSLYREGLLYEVQDFNTKSAKEFYDQFKARLAETGCESSLRYLQEISARLKNGDMDSLSALARLIPKVSSFELFYSDCIDALLVILSSPKSQQVFLRSFTTDALIPLVQSCNEILSRMETFQIVHFEFDDNTPRGRRVSKEESALKLLSKLIRVKLEAYDQDSALLPQYRTIVLSVQAIAMLKSVEEFLTNEFGRSHSSNAFQAFIRGRFSNHEAFSRVLEGAEQGQHDLDHRSERAMEVEADYNTEDSIDVVERSGTMEISQVFDHSGNGDVSASHTMEDDGLDGDEDEDVGDEEDEDEDEDDDVDDDDDDEEEEDDDDDEDDEDEDEEENEDEEDEVVLRAGSSSSRNLNVTREDDGDQFLASLRYARGRARGAQRSSREDPYHLEFFVDDSPVDRESTVLGAIYKHLEAKGEVPQESVWQSVFTIKYRRKAGRAPEKNQPVVGFQYKDGAKDAPEYIDSKLSKVLRLLCVLHGLHESLPLEEREAYLSKFLNWKLTSKLNRQLQEPLAVASGILPLWTVDTVRLYPFLFPFDTRLLFVQSTSFGYSRYISRLQVAATQAAGNQAGLHGGRISQSDRIRLNMGRQTKQKARITRKHIMHSAVKAMKICGAAPEILEVEFFDEEGTGLGPTLEFYTLVSHEFCMKKYGLWRDAESDPSSEVYYSKTGLFPAPLSSDVVKATKCEQLFHVLGTFMARALLDSRLIDVQLNQLFFDLALDKPLPLTLEKLAVLDPRLAQSLATLQELAQEGDVAGLHLDNALPGYPECRLSDTLSDVITNDDVHEYIEAVIRMTLRDSVTRQVEAFRSGFNEVFPITALKAFTTFELVSMCGHSTEDWSFETLHSAIKADHGYTKESSAVVDLITNLSELSLDQRRSFMQFLTGSPHLPLGGFKALKPEFTVVCKHAEKEENADMYLPSVMTCANYLKLPNYSSRYLAKAKLIQAIKEGSGAFLLS